jgi:hypothetical protein
MSEKTTIFTEGFYLNKVSERAPEFIKTNISIKLDQATPWLLGEARKHMDKDGFVRLVGKESKGGKLYFEVDTYQKPTEAAAPAADDVEIPW